MSFPCPLHPPRPPAPRLSPIAATKLFSLPIESRPCLIGGWRSAGVTALEAGENPCHVTAVRCQAARSARPRGSDVRFVTGLSTARPPVHLSEQVESKHSNKNIPSVHHHVCDTLLSESPYFAMSLSWIHTSQLSRCRHVQGNPLRVTGEALDKSQVETWSSSGIRRDTVWVRVAWFSQRQAGQFAKCFSFTRPPCVTAQNALNQRASTTLPTLDLTLLSLIADRTSSHASTSI